MPYLNHKQQTCRERNYGNRKCRTSSETGSVSSCFYNIKTNICFAFAFLSKMCQALGFQVVIYSIFTAKLTRKKKRKWWKLPSYPSRRPLAFNCMSQPAWERLGWWIQPWAAAFWRAALTETGDFAGEATNYLYCSQTFPHVCVFPTMNWLTLTKKTPPKNTSVSEDGA